MATNFLKFCMAGSDGLTLALGASRVNCAADVNCVVGSTLGLETTVGYW